MVISLTEFVVRRTMPIRRMQFSSAEFISALSVSSQYRIPHYCNCYGALELTLWRVMRFGQWAPSGITFSIVRGNRNGGRRLLLGDTTMQCLRLIGVLDPRPSSLYYSS